MEIKTDFPGGNIEVLKVENNVVHVKPQMRDTKGDWFYWAFCVTGAQGKTITFDFTPYGYVGYYGPAVSHDFKEWRWLGKTDCYTSFSYSFGPHEGKVYFAHDMLYGKQRFKDFAKDLGLPVKRLCVSEKGRDVPVTYFGEGEQAILLTARHHCCESTGSYVLEGVLDELYRKPIKGYRVIAVPFVDLDGVEEGDQGKNRIPHDHNRDYTEKSLYNSVKSIMQIIMDNPIRFAFDFHSPWHFGGRNDKVFFVRSRVNLIDKYMRLGRFFEEEAGGPAMKYSIADDINPGEEWNKPQFGLGFSFSSFCMQKPGVELAFTVETTYFGGPDDIVSQEKLVNTGRAFARALRKYIGE